MKKHPLGNPLKSLKKLFFRYNFVIFIVIISIGLMAAVLYLSGIMNSPYSNSDGSTIFDTTTINRLDQLQPSAKNTAYKTISPGRTNPFSE
jgi:hypothetical protein